MRPVLLSALLLATGLAVACGGGGSSTSPTDGPVSRLGSGPVRRPKADPPAEPKTVRTLDAAAAKELAAAWGDNPVAAEKRYKDVRFRVKVRLHDISPLGATAVAVEKGVSAHHVTFADGQVERVSTRGEHTLEVRVRDYRPGTYGGVSFTDATAID